MGFRHRTYHILDGFVWIRIISPEIYSPRKSGLGEAGFRGGGSLGVNFVPGAIVGLAPPRLSRTFRAAKFQLKAVPTQTDNYIIVYNG